MVERRFHTCELVAVQACNPMHKRAFNRFLFLLYAVTRSAKLQPGATCSAGRNRIYEHPRY